jgi:hypothetical protein
MKEIRGFGFLFREVELPMVSFLVFQECAQDKVNYSCLGFAIC